MTTLERDLKDIERNGLDIASTILRERKAALDKLEHEYKTCENSLRRSCIATDWNRLKKEYDVIDAMI